MAGADGNANTHLAVLLATRLRSVLIAFCAPACSLSALNFRVFIKQFSLLEVQRTSIQYLLDVYGTGTSYFIPRG